MEINGKTTIIQLIKYGIIGVSNTLITFVAFVILNNFLGVVYTVANVVGYILGVLNSFVWNRTWVFHTKSNLWREFGLFIVGFGICWTIQYLATMYMLNGLEMNKIHVEWIPMAKQGESLVMIIGMVIYTLCNYAYNRFITFKHK